MLRISVTGLSILAITLLGVSPQPPEKKTMEELHPQGGGHPALPEKTENWPKGKAEDVGSVDSIIAAYYSATAGEPNQPRDWDRFMSLFLPDGRLIVSRPRGDGTTGAFVLPPDDFVAMNRKYLEKGGLVEREIGRRTESFGTICQVWSTFESRRSKDSPTPYARGINSFQLLNGGDRWWIVTVLWDHERMENPIPEKYTTTPKE